jgi:hypothetical protein
MGEYEALIERRQMLLDRISKVSYEVEKIDLRLDFLGRINMSEQFDQYRMQERLVQEYS